MAEATTAAPAAAAPAPVAPSGAPIVENGEGYAQAQFTPEQTAAISHLAELRTQAADPALDHGKRDALMKKMSELTHYIHLGAKEPAWLPGAKPDPRLSDNSEYNDMAEIGAPLSESMSRDELASMKSAGTIRGMHPTVSGAVAAFVSEMAMPKVIADLVLNSAVKHFGATFGNQASSSVAEAFLPLNEAERQDFHKEASRLCGGSDKLEALSKEVRELLQARGILSEFDKRGYTKSSLAYDPRFLGTLRLWLKTSAPARA